MHRAIHSALLVSLLFSRAGAAQATPSQKLITGSTRQALSVGLQSYFKAKKILDAAVGVIGGNEALLSAKTVRRQLAGDWFGSGQHPRPYVVQAPSMEIPPSNGRNRVVSVVDYGARRFLDESVEADVASDDFITRVTAVGEETGFETIKYRDENPYLRRYLADDARSALVRKLRQYPEGLLRMALERPETLEWVGTGEELGRGQQVISFADANGARVFLYVEQKTNLLKKSETLREHAIAGDSYTEQIYLDYRPVGGLRLPFHIITCIAGIPSEVMRVSSIEVNANVPEERFQAPESFVAMGQNSTSPVVEKLGEHLYTVQGPYNIMFADFQDYVIVFEAPLSSRYTESCLALIRATVPNKPVRYVVATHFHYDHVAGLRPYIAAGVTIITTPDAKAIIEEVAASQRTMYPDALSRTPRAPRIETVSGHREFSDALNHVEIHDIGPSDHAFQMLGAYFPAEKLLFEADLWDPISLDLSIAGADATKMASKIQELGLDVERIIPVHGINANFEALKKGVAVRAKYSAVPQK